MHAQLCGNSTHIGELLEDTGKVVTLDLHQHKVKLIKEAAGRIGLSNIEARALDARKAGEVFEPEQFDRVSSSMPRVRASASSAENRISNTAKRPKTARVSPGFSLRF